MILSTIRVNSSRINIGPPTKNNDNGSGGDTNAPNNKDINHKNLLFSITLSRLTIPLLRKRMTIRGI